MTNHKPNKIKHSKECKSNLTHDSWDCDCQNISNQQTAKDEIKKIFDLDYFGDITTEQAVDSIFNWHISQLKELEKEIKKMKKDRHIPYQALYFGRGCPGCGREMNRKWINEKVKEVRDHGLSDVLDLIKNYEK